MRVSENVYTITIMVYYWWGCGDTMGENDDTRGGETMGPVHFNNQRVKQEDRYGKRRK